MESQGRHWAALGPLCSALGPKPGKWEWRVLHQGATACISMFPLHINHYNKLAHFDCSLGMLEIIYVCHHRNLLLHQSKMTAALRLSWLWETGRERIGSRWDGAATGGELSFLLDELSFLLDMSSFFSWMSSFFSWISSLLLFFLGWALSHSFLLNELSFSWMSYFLLDELSLTLVSEMIYNQLFSIFY